jgi:hypothetical protein
MLGLSNGVDPDVTKAVLKKKRAGGLKNHSLKNLEAHLPAKIYANYLFNFLPKLRVWVSCLHRARLTNTVHR